MSNLLNTKTIELPFIGTIMICVFLFGYTLVSQNKISRTWIELRSGSAKAYYYDMQKIYQVCALNKGKNLVFSPMKNRPNTIFINDLHINPKHWENISFSKFHEIESARTDSLILNR